jgi:hypothetical protein
MVGYKLTDENTCKDGHHSAPHWCPLRKRAALVEFKEPIYLDGDK